MTTRLAMAAVFIGGIISFNPAARAAACFGFVDVDDTAGYCAAVDFVRNKGVTVGCSDATHYCPDQVVTRAQMATFMYRLARGGPHNTLANALATIGGGDYNYAVDNYTTVGGGGGNHANVFADTVGGGYNNTAGSPNGSATVAGGYTNQATGNSAAVGGGDTNHATANYSAIPGGQNNTASAQHATVLGGLGNQASGVRATTVGGYVNSALGAGSLAAGSNAIAPSSGTFTWSDASGYFFDPSAATSVWSSAANTFNARAVGGVWFVSGIDGSGNPAAGVKLTSGSGTWASASDRALKHDFRAVDVREVLDRVAAMPITTWAYNTEPGGVRHLGPVAQDFHAAFGLGPDDVSITTIDASGVALAAIQGLKGELDATRDALAAERAANAQLAARLERLERAVGR